MIIIIIIFSGNYRTRGCCCWWKTCYKAVYSSLEWMFYCIYGDLNEIERKRTNESNVFGSIRVRRTAAEDVEPRDGPWAWCLGGISASDEKVAQPRDDGDRTEAAGAGHRDELR